MGGIVQCVVFVDMVDLLVYGIWFGCLIEGYDDCYEQCNGEGFGEVVQKDQFLVVL